MILTDEDIAELGRLEKEATPGPWSVYPQPVETRDDARRELSQLVAGTMMFSGILPILTAPGDACPATTGCGTDGLPNAEFIAALRNAAPALLAAARENRDSAENRAVVGLLREENAALRELLGKARKFVKGYENRYTAALIDAALAAGREGT